MDLLRGTLDPLILRVADRSLYGYGIVDRIRRVTDDTIRVEDGALYGALHRMQERGFLDGYWDVTTEGRRAKFSELTAVRDADLGFAPDNLYVVRPEVEGDLVARRSAGSDRARRS